LVTWSCHRRRSWQSCACDTTSHIGALQRLRDWRLIRLDPRTPITIATGNSDKLREIVALWGSFLPPVTAVSGDYQEVDETGETYEENATIKAAALAELIGGPALADDSGIEVEVLGWGPGVRSARTPYAGAPPAERNENILRAVAGKSRAARFVSVCALVVSGYEPVIGRGEVQGFIAERALGSNGFGYDPIFLYEPYHQTFGQVDTRLKHAVSHRGGAIRSLQTKLGLLGQ